MSLQIPSPSRPVSVAVAPTPSSARRQPPQHRASHQIVSSTPDHDQQPQQPAYTDVYSHPAAIAFAAAHPRRTIPKFGPYLLLQTLGEGEFGKVKLGLHSQWGEEVAVKLIRKGNVENSAVRMSKVEREIEVLRVSRAFSLFAFCCLSGRSSGFPLEKSRLYPTPRSSKASGRGCPCQSLLPRRAATLLRLNTWVILPPSGVDVTSSNTMANLARFLFLAIRPKFPALGLDLHMGTSYAPLITISAPAHILLYGRVS